MFACTNNNLTSLEFCPSTIGGSFYCHYNNLTSLEFCPSTIGGEFFCQKNPLSLRKIHKHIKQMNGQFTCGIVPNMLGLLLIRGVTDVLIFGSTHGEGREIADILNSHLKTKDIHACQEELIDAGYAEQARL